jgi:hypothetical protein
MVEPGDIATWAAAAVAVVAAVFTGKQATEAAKSRKAAETQARAAEAQVTLMRAERDERDAPDFSVSAIEAEDTGYFAAKITLRMDRGRVLRSLTIRASGDYLEPNGLHRFTTDTGGIAAGVELTFDDVRQGSELVFYASAKDGFVASTVGLDLACQERDGDARTWQRHYACTIDQRSPRTWPRFTPL